MKKANHQLIILVCIIFCFTTATFANDDPLPSWNEGESKEAIFSFVNKITNKNTSSYIQPAERIAVFDNDGTLWAEQPMYVQLVFAIDRVKQLAPEHPEWKNKYPFDAALEGDINKLLKNGNRSLMALIMASHAGTTTDEFSTIVKNWLSSAKHPKTGRSYTDMVYLPMLELLTYLRSNDFHTYIVSGGGVEFMRPWTEKVYGIPPEQVIGSSIKTKFIMKNGEPVLMRLPEINFIDDKEGKPIGIHQHIGRRPIAAFGNSDGDLQMLQWTMSGEGKHFAMIVHHNDAKREWAYDRKSHIGHLDKALDEAKSKGWTIVDMKTDWKQIYITKKVSH